MIKWLYGLAGVVCVGTETFGVFDFLIVQQGKLNYIVLAGCLTAALAPTCPSLSSRLGSRGLRGAQMATWIVFGLCVALVVLSAVARIGETMDTATARRDQAQRVLALTTQAVQDAEAEVKSDKAAQLVECSGKGERGNGCKSIEAKLAASQARLDEHRRALQDVPAVPPVPLWVRLLSDALGLQPSAVVLYSPLLLPLALFGLGTVFLRAAFHVEHQAVPISKNSVPAVPIVSNRVPTSNVVALREPGRVAKFMLEMIEAKSKGGLEVAEIMDAYRKWCTKTSREPVSAEVFTEELALLIKDLGVSVSERGGSMFLEGVKLARRRA